MKTKPTRSDLQRLHNEVVTACRLWQAAQFGTNSKAIANARYVNAEADFADALIASFEPWNAGL